MSGKPTPREGRMAAFLSGVLFVLALLSPFDVGHMEGNVWRAAFMALIAGLLFVVSIPLEEEK